MESCGYILPLFRKKSRNWLSSTSETSKMESWNKDFPLENLHVVKYILSTMTQIRIGFLLFLSCLPLSGFGETRIEQSNWKQEWRELEEEMLQLVNKERKKLNAPPLAMDSLTQVVARSHSMDMAKRRYVGHDSPEGEDLQDRLFKADVYAEEYGENVGKHLTMNGAHVGLMESIRHRRNILKPRFTHIGIGILRGEDGYLYITQNFIKKIEPIDLELAKTRIFLKLNLSEDSNLSAIAKKHTSKIFEEEDIQISVPIIEEEARVFTWRGPSLDEFLEIEEVRNANGPRAGVGILQGSSRKYGTGLLWITLIVSKD